VSLLGLEDTLQGQVHEMETKLIHLPLQYREIALNRSVARKHGRKSAKNERRVVNQGEVRTHASSNDVWMVVPRIALRVLSADL